MSFRASHAIRSRRQLYRGTNLDNLTHTLIGVTAGEAIARSTSRADDPQAISRRNLLVMVGAIGSNLPDLDLVLSYNGLTRNKLAYLLQHRGYTHTLIGCAVLALLLYAGSRLWAQYRHLPLPRRDRLVLAATCATGLSLHLAMDGLNSYGAHPFWPFDNAWIYGDSVFIVEPAYWLTAAPLIFALRTATARVLLGLILLLGVGIGIAMNLAQPMSAATIAIATAALLFAGWRSSPRGAALLSAAMLPTLTLWLVVAHAAAARQMAAIATTSFPGATTLDVVMTPMPANRTCWDVLLLQTQAGRYFARHAILSTATNDAAVGGCPRLMVAAATTAPMTGVGAPSSARIDWIGEFSMPQGRFAQFATRYCAARELLQFARAPFAVATQNRRVIGDLRFDREVELGFAELELRDANAPCLYDLPWLPPRGSLLGLGRKTALPASASNPPLAD